MLLLLYHPGGTVQRASNLVSVLYWLVYIAVAIAYPYSASCCECVMLPPLYHFYSSLTVLFAATALGAYGFR